MNYAYTSFHPPPAFPLLDPSKDYLANTSNPFYVQRETELNLGDATTRDFYFMLAEWYVIFSVIMQVNILVYKCTQLSSLEPVFRKKGHEEFNDFLAQKRIEYRVYGRMLLGLSVFEITQSLIEYVFWRGVPYFSVPEPYTMYCKQEPVPGNSTFSLGCMLEPIDDPKSYITYHRYSSNCTLASSDNNCMHVKFLWNPSSLIVGITVWYLLRFLINTFNLFFCMMMLARNTKGKKGKAFWSGHLKKALIYSVLVFVVEFSLLLQSNYRIFFRFEGLAVLIIYIIEKVLMFFLLFDKYSVKDWSDNKLKSKYVHIKGIEWREEYGEAMKQTFSVFKTRLAERKRKEPLFQEHSVQILAIYQENFERYAEQQIFQRHFWTYDHKPDKLFELNWADYINYQLMVTALGAAGYFLMMIPTAATYGRGTEQYRLFEEGENLLFSVGMLLAMSEILLLKITKDIRLTNVIYRDVATQFQARSKKLKCQYIADF